MKFQIHNGMEYKKTKLGEVCVRFQGEVSKVRVTEVPTLELGVRYANVYSY